MKLNEALEILIQSAKNELNNDSMSKRLVSLDRAIEIAEEALKDNGYS
jgi:hypothetical protein